MTIFSQNEMFLAAGDSRSQMEFWFSFLILNSFCVQNVLKVATINFPKCCCALLSGSFFFDLFRLYGSEFWGKNMPICNCGHAVALGIQNLELLENAGPSGQPLTCQQVTFSFLGSSVFRKGGISITYFSFIPVRLARYHRES